ncbi:M12 family metallopeptidase [Hydrogenophaga sp. Root209]|uniref:M12 family metallopeptidase n=1 Tax=Hydrogenophaga sp. Root209 TaxID=1736490 RepID=UPI000ABF7AE3|nr:M12 family metallopeptidase [Hydrogenophaga sp. Root209]
MNSTVLIVPMAAALLAVSGKAVAHDLVGLDTERQLLSEALPAIQDPMVQATPIPPALARQLIQARERQQAFQVLFPEKSSKPSFMAQLVARGSVPYSVFLPSEKWKVGITLKVCFHSGGGEAAKRRIEQIASQWSKYGSIYFDFGKAPGFNFCDYNDGAQIRISFRQKGYFSLIGNQALLSDRKNAVTMGLQDLDTGRYPIEGEKFKSIVIHEFGHAIGLAHEHQHPAVDCYPQFNIEAIMREYDWKEDKVITNLRMLQVSRVTTAGNFYMMGLDAKDVSYEFSNDPDMDSVMRYHLREEDFKKPPGSCYDPTMNSEPSKGDQDAIARAYPRENATKRIQTQNALIENILKAHPNLTAVERASLRAFKL